MKLSEYYKVMAEVDGIVMPEPDPRITRKDLDFRGGKGKEGSATITFLDGKPVYLNWYIWDLDHNWMVGQVEKELDSKIKLSNFSGGNGHCGADLELLQIRFVSEGGWGLLSEEEKADIIKGDNEKD